jgi:hypothetical protein
MSGAAGPVSVARQGALAIVTFDAPPLNRELAQGPTLAHAATKQVLRDYPEGR